MNQLIIYSYYEIPTNGKILRRLPMYVGHLEPTCFVIVYELLLIDKFYLIMAGVLLIMTTILIMIIWTINS